jgi:hypothetical protein
LSASSRRGTSRSRSGLEDRAGARVRQHVVMKPADLVPGLRVGDCRDPGERRLAGWRVQPRDGDAAPVVGETIVTSPEVGRHQLHRARSRRAATSPRRRSRGWRRSSSRWAARTRS